MRWKDVVKVRKILEQNQGVIIKMNLPPLINFISRLITYLYYYTLRMLVLEVGWEKSYKVFEEERLVEFLGEPREEIVKIVYTIHIYFEDGKRHRWGQLNIYQTNPGTEGVRIWTVKYEVES